MMDIGYYSEPVSEYGKGLDACHSPQELRAFLSEWKGLASDALDSAGKITTKTWDGFHRGLQSERKGKFAGTAWAEQYNDILLPLVLFQVSIVANRFMVPWGTAYIRCKEVGWVVEEDGVAVWKGRTNAQ